MPWEYLLGSAATGAGTVIVLALIFWKKLVDRTVDSGFDTRLEKLKSELSGSRIFWPGENDALDGVGRLQKLAANPSSQLQVRLWK